MATLAVPISSKRSSLIRMLRKVVTDAKGYALYFSRAPIAWERDNFAKAERQMKAPHARHVGIYAYRAGFIRQYVGWEPSPLEQIEALEQLRVLWHGERIHKSHGTGDSPAGVDTIEDLERVRNYLAQALGWGPLRCSVSHQARGRFGGPFY